MPPECSKCGEFWSNCDQCGDMHCPKCKGACRAEPESEPTEPMSDERLKERQLQCEKPLATFSKVAMGEVLDEVVRLRKELAEATKCGGCGEPDSADYHQCEECFG